MVTISERINSPTPKFFKKLRNIGLILAAVSGTILAAPVALPAVIITAAGYLSVAGAVAGAVSQLTIADTFEKNVADTVNYEQELAYEREIAAAKEAVLKLRDELR